MREVDIFYEKVKLFDSQKIQYEKYYKLIYEYNQKMNLTGIDDKSGVYLKHFYDSILLHKFLDKYNIGTKVADLGSGAGFPGIVLAIYYPNYKFYLIEPIKKRCKFLEIVVGELCLKNVYILNKRAEEINNESFDVVVSRAVSTLNVLLELGIPMLKKEGVLIAQKGPRVQEEIFSSKNALEILKAKIVDIQEEILPFENSVRYNLSIKKQDITDSKYPRNYGLIKKKPL